MKKLAIISMLFVASTSTAFAEELNQYISAKGALVNISSDFKTNTAYHYKNNVSNMGASTDAKDTVMGMRLAYGLAFPAPNGKIRAELEYSWNEKAKDSSWTTVKFGKKAESTFKYNVKTSIQNTWMVNGYYDFDTQTLFTPYVTAGVGYAKVKLEGAGKGAIPVNNKTTDNNIAWNLGLGVAYAVTPKLSLDVGYKYTNYGEVKTKHVDVGSQGFAGNFVGTMKAKVTSQELTAGVRYQF